MGAGSVAEYYQTCAFPKPGNSKKKKLHNGYKDKPSRVCAYCGRPSADRHEVFGASNRQLSIELKFQVDVCNDHHMELHENSTEWAKKENARLRRNFQLKYMRTCMNEGMTGRQALNAWMLQIGRNYVDELTP